jgi:integrative and conjugative element protein (TIGR02256 family)
MALNSYRKCKAPFNYEAWSIDRKYGLRIPSKVLQKILQLCSSSGSNETGGIIIGYYTRRLDCAVVTDCSGPPLDSKSGSNYFGRGIKGLQRWLMSLWNLTKRRYYLGEWHFHPFANPQPSGVDINQLEKNAKNKSYHCSEPIMFIIGGDPNNDWSCVTLLYIKEKGLIELYRQWENDLK